MCYGSFRHFLYIPRRFSKTVVTNVSYEGPSVLHPQDLDHFG